MSTRLLKKQLAALAAAQDSHSGIASSASKSGNPTRVQKRKGQKRPDRKARRDLARTVAPKTAPAEIAKRNLEYFQRTLESKAAAKTAALMSEALGLPPPPQPEETDEDLLASFGDIL